MAYFLAMTFKKKNNAKKVLCLIDSLGAGGAERQIVGLAVLLKKKGYSLDLVSYHAVDFYADEALKGGVEPCILTTEKSSLAKLLAVRRFIKVSGGYDCVITYKDGSNVIGCLLKLFGMKSLLSTKN